MQISSAAAVAVTPWLLLRIVLAAWLRTYPRRTAIGAAVATKASSTMTLGSLVTSRDLGLGCHWRLNRNRHQDEATEWHRRVVTSRDLGLGGASPLGTIGRPPVADLTINATESEGKEMCSATNEYAAPP